MFIQTSYMVMDLIFQMLLVESLFKMKEVHYQL